jgi:hypothetical protein
VFEKMSTIFRNVIFSERKAPAGPLHNIAQALGWGGRGITVTGYRKN